MKKVISLVLCLTVILATFVFAAPSSAAVEPGRTIKPVIYLNGTGSTIVRNNEDGTQDTLYPLQIPDGYIDEKVNEFLPVFAQAFFTQQWDEFCDVLVDILMPIFEPMKLDENGEASDGSHVYWSWSKEELENKKHNGTYGVQDYTYIYDWRLSPLDIADGLHEYIQAVMDVTGAEQVAIMGRCYGSNVAAAYMKKYGGDHISEVIHYASAVGGASFLSKIFTGELYLESDSLERFLYDMDLDIGAELNDLLRAFVTVLNDTYGLDIACWAVNNVFKDIYLDIIPEVIVNSYGSFPSSWAMVCPEDYARAKETVFYGSDLEKYAGLIEKNDNYHNNVQLPFENDLKKQIEGGVEFFNIVKYGKQDAPVTNKGDQTSDFLVLVNDASYGATAVKVGQTFSDSYMETAKSFGTEKYISPDRIIDASTCISPDTTWFIKDLHHYHFPNSSNALISEMVNNDGFTVRSNAEYPQYLRFNESNSEITPLVADNMDTTPEWNTSFIEAFGKIFKILFNMIKNAIQTA